MPSPNALNPPDESEWRKLRDAIDARFPAGRFVAVEQGRVLADAPSFRELDDALKAMGKTSKEILVVQAGVEIPEFAFILSVESESEGNCGR